MRDVAIIGAGELGGSLAELLAVRDVARDIRLIDEHGETAAGKALDLMQASALTGSSIRIAGSTHLTAAAGASVIVLADRSEGGEWQGRDGLLVLRRLSQLGAPPPIVCAGAAAQELVERGVREAGFDRRRLFGSAPEALAAALRVTIALEAGGSPNDVALTVLGVPPAHIVVPWEDTTVRGFSIGRVLDDQARRRTLARAALLWPPGPRTLAAAACQAAAAMLGRSRRAVAAFVAPDDSAGRRFRASAMPVALGPTGIERVEAPPLNPRDRVALDNAVLL